MVHFGGPDRRYRSMMRAPATKLAVHAASTLGATTALAIVMSAAVLQPPRSSSKTAFAGKLPALDGQRLTATLVEVTYPPGGANPAHRHPCPVVGYVLEGAIRMQLEGRAERVVQAGESFFESPADVHAVSANASTSAPVRFLAYFVCDRDTPLSVPVGRARAEE
jgi:quercetin dioxygenase-like cupin family protein